MLGQLWLFPPPAPLVERLGEEFFRALPSGPGVYLMCGAGPGVLYVGKARSLRKRLSSYRVANPERFPRRMIRLLHRVTRIEWDACSSEAAARHREEELICVLMPRFNAAGKAWPIEGSARVVWKRRLARTEKLLAELSCHLPNDSPSPGGEGRDEGELKN
jgi:hypothetical protein